MIVADKIWDVVKLFTNAVFMLPGGGAMYLVDALGRSGLEYYPCMHEQGAALAACGYARASGKLGVCLVTSGPGATNALTAVASAWADSYPLLVISGQTSRDQFIPSVRSSGVQSVDIIPVVDPMTKFAFRPTTAHGAITMTRILADIALSGRQGPVWLDVPMDLQGEEVEIA